MNCVHHKKVPAVPGKVRCQTCIDRNSKCAKNRRQKLKKLGLCQHHPTIPVVDGTTRCQECRENRDRDKRDRSARRIAAGVCVYHKNRPRISTRYCQECIDSLKQRRQGIKERCFDHYGHMCRCCLKIYDLIFLTLDHVNNDGNKHRKSVNGRNNGHSFYAWAIKNNFPDIFQTLCFNCNHAKHLNGGICPCNNF